MKPWPPHVYRAIGNSQGVPDEIVERALEQAHQVQLTQSVPAILTLNHLATQVGIPYPFLREVVERERADFYRTFPIRKRAGGRRRICVPHPYLLQTQKWLARHVLGGMAIHPASYAYAKAKSILKCAHLHCQCRWLIKVDVRQFFESISERQVYHAFRAIGYQPLVSFELARICTRVNKSSVSRYSIARWRNQIGADNSVIPTYRCRWVGYLPQGAPTSPTLSNLVMLDFDRRMHTDSAAKGLVYTRYSDDLLFSTASRSFERVDAERLVRDVYRELQEFGLRPHTAKTHIAPPGARKIVLGLLVDTEKPRLTRAFRKKLEQHLYCLQRFGPLVHAESRGFKSIFSMKLHIKGLLQFAWDIDTRYASPLMELFEAVRWPD